MKAVALAGLSLLLATTEVPARCLSRGEAVAAYPKAHLYWSVGRNGKCWANSLASARRDAKGIPARRVVREPEPPPTPEPPPEPMPPPGQHPAPPLQTTPIDLESLPQWSWVAAARAAVREDKEEPFSTFKGEPPEFWPPLEKEPVKDNTAIQLVVIFWIIFITTAGAVAWWQRRVIDGSRKTKAAKNFKTRPFGITDTEDGGDWDSRMFPGHEPRGIAGVHHRLRFSQKKMV